MTKEEIEALAQSVDNPELAKQHGMVTQVWEDGELTSQKSGDLLWQRTLHMFERGVQGAATLSLTFPHRSGGHSFAWVTTRDGYRVRKAIKEMLGDTSTDPMAEWHLKYGDD